MSKIGFEIKKLIKWLMRLEISCKFFQSFLYLWKGLPRYDLSKAIYKDEESKLFEKGYINFKKDYKLETDMPEPVLTAREVIFLWSWFSSIRTEYRDLLRKFPYSFQIHENMDHKKLHILILFNTVTRKNTMELDKI